jgi:hypothetical protein
MTLDRERIVALLRARNVDLEELASRPEAFERACKVIYKSIPIPLRWIVRKRRVRAVVGLVRDTYVKAGGPGAHRAEE